MDTLVIYDSVYGNTKAIAQASASALPGGAQVVHVSSVDPEQLTNVGLLVIGSPTQGALPTEAIQRLVNEIGASIREGARASTFDTR